MDEWHFPRKNLAEQYLGFLELGISSSFAIIAPRRKGKTLFLLQDLAPLARKNGYIPVYASLWQNTNAPQEGLIAALEEALEALDKTTALTRLLNTKIRKTAISNDLLGKMEVEFADNPTSPSSQDLARLDQLLVALESKAGKKTILLLVDEIQHLSTSSQFDSLAHTFRTLLDKRQGRIKSIFTGSSRHFMDLLFNESQSPFYHFVEPLYFPDLDEPFIAFIRNKLSSEHTIKVALKPLQRAFDSLDCSPYWMMKLVAVMITQGASVHDALDQVLRLMDAAEDFEGISQRMRTIDRLVFSALCKGMSPFSKEMMARIDAEADVKGVQSNIQRAIERLSEANLISHDPKGGYYIEKPGLQRYLEHHAK